MLSLLRAPKREDAGFTLIELLVVIVIIGILAAIAVPLLISQRKKAAEASIKSDLRNVATSMETYYTDFEAYPSVAAAAGVAALGANTINLARNNIVSTTVAPASGKFCLHGRSTDTSVPEWYYTNVGGGLTTTAPATANCH